MVFILVGNSDRSTKEIESIEMEKKKGKKSKEKKQF